MRCDLCKFWVKGEQFGDDETRHVDEKRGSCHRLPPSPLVGDVAHEILEHLTQLVHASDSDLRENYFDSWEEAPQASSSWPTTEASDWCGEFSARVPE